MSNSSPYSSLLSKLRLPQPQLSRQAVTSLFKALTPNLSSAAARDAISQCLRSPSAAVVDQAVRELCRLFSLGLVDRSVALLEIQSALEGCDARFVGVLVKGLGFLCRFGFGTDGEWRTRRFDPVELHPFVKVRPSPTTLHISKISKFGEWNLSNHSPNLEISKFDPPNLEGEEKKWRVSP